MVVFLHIVVALASIVLATVTFFSPHKTLFIFTYGLIGTTLVSGTYLVWSDSTRMLHVCLVGVMYLAIVAAITLLARIRLANRQRENGLSL